MKDKTPILIMGVKVVELNTLEGSKPNTTLHAVNTMKLTQNEKKSNHQRTFQWLVGVKESLDYKITG